MPKNEYEIGSNKDMHKASLPGPGEGAGASARMAVLDEKPKDFKRTR